MCSHMYLFSHTKEMNLWTGLTEMVVRDTFMFPGLFQAKLFLFSLSRVRWRGRDEEGGKEAEGGREGVGKKEKKTVLTYLI